MRLNYYPYSTVGHAKYNPETRSPVSSVLSSRWTINIGSVASVTVVVPWGKWQKKERGPNVPSDVCLRPTHTRDTRVTYRRWTPIFFNYSEGKKGVNIIGLGSVPKHYLVSYDCHVYVKWYYSQSKKKGTITEILSQFTDLGYIVSGVVELLTVIKGKWRSNDWLHCRPLSK